MKIRIAVDASGAIAEAMRQPGREVRLRFTAEAKVTDAEIKRACERVNTERLLDRRHTMKDEIVGPLPLLSGYLLVLDLVLNNREADVEVIGVEARST